MRPEKETMNEAEMIANVRHSTDSALQALKIFHQSLIRAHMLESSRVYRTMCDTLVGQRIWMLDKNNAEVESNFNELSSLAREINNVLSPYVTSFEKLATLGNGNEGGEPNLSEVAQYEAENGESSDANFETESSTASGIEMEVLDLVRRNKGKISATSLKSKSKLKKRDFEELISAMQAKSLLMENTVSGRRFIELGNAG